MIILKIIGVLFLIGIIVLTYFWFNVSQDMMKHITKNPTNGSIYLKKNNKVILDKHADRLMPLASTVKIIVAIEFVKQVSSNKIDISQNVSLDELEKYHLQYTDGGAHQEWLSSMKKQKHIIDNKINILEVVKGMIEFSSNANTEYLMDQLGYENLDRLLKELALKQHEKLYPFVSSLFVLKDNSLETLNKMTKKEYIELSFQINKRLKAGEIDTKLSKEDLKKNFTKEKIKLFSEYFIQGTAKEYVSIIEKLNSREYFSTIQYAYIDYIMTPTYPSTDAIHSGFKGGSTRFILTMAFYGTYKNGDKIEVALFLNNLNIFQYYYYYIGFWKIDLDILKDKKLIEFQNILKEN